MPSAASGLGLQQRMSGSEPLALLRESYVGTDNGDEVALLRTNHHHDLVSDGTGRPDRVGDEGAATKPMEYLGLARAHALALSRRKNHRCQLAHADLPPRPRLANIMPFAKI